MCESNNFVIYFVIAFLVYLVAFKRIYHIFLKTLFLTSNLSEVKIKRNKKRRKKEKRKEKEEEKGKGSKSKN